MSAPGGTVAGGVTKLANLNRGARDRRQKTEDRRQKTEDRRRKTGARGDRRKRQPACVTPAKAGAQRVCWIPASAGMTRARETASVRHPGESRGPGGVLDSGIRRNDEGERRGERTFRSPAASAAGWPKAMSSGSPKAQGRRKQFETEAYLGIAASPAAVTAALRAATASSLNGPRCSQRTRPSGPTSAR